MRVHGLRFFTNRPNVNRKVHGVMPEADLSAPRKGRRQVSVSGMALGRASGERRWFAAPYFWGFVPCPA